MQERDRAYISRNKKLVRTLTFSVVLLVAATLVMSSSLTAMDLQGNSKPMNKINNYTNTVWISSATDNIPGIESDPVTTQGTPAFTDYIHFDDGTNSNSLGLTSGGTFEYGIRITPTELTGYDGWELSSVRHHHGWSGSTAPSVSGNIKIYGAGTPTSPGTLLVSEPYTTLAVPGWEEYTLSSPVVIDETQDIWVCLEVTHAAGEYPAGMDPGPAVDGKGDWIYLSPGPWQEIQDLGFDENWNIWAGLEEGGPGPDHDVGVQSINSPVSGPAGVFNPEVTVKNYGDNPETSVPVNMDITAYGTPTVYFSDGFESYSIGHYDMPDGWTVQTTNPTGSWYMYSSSTSYSASTYPRVQESGSDGNAQDESLISPVIDCSALTTVHLQLKLFYFYAYAPDYASFTISGSNDGGSTWTTIDAYTATSTGAKDFDITSWAAGQSAVQFKFQFESPADATLSSYCYFDNMWVGDPTGDWGPYGDNPPAGWTIERFDTTAWDYNHWHRSPSTSTSYDMYGYYARMYYATPYTEVNDNLISPSIDCSGLSKVILQFNCYFYAYTTYNDKVMIQISTDGGTTWQDQDIWQLQGYSYQYCYWYEWYNGYDITALAAGQSDVKIRFHFERPDGATGGYMYLDNVRVSDGSGTFKFVETFDTGKAVYFTVFKNFIHDDWDGIWDWNIVSGPYPLLKWQGASSSSDPVCTPYEGLSMAQYYNTYPGKQAMLYSIPMNVAAASTLKMSFWMYHDTQSGYIDGNVAVLASHDGITWENMGTISRNDGTTGWSVHIIDLSGYEDDTALQIAFLGTTDYAAYMNIDDVQVFDPGLITEYSETVYVNLAVGETKDVTFPTWTPDAWQVQGNVDIIYELYASTDLATDVNPDNDLEQATIVLNYPYLHDIAVMSIDNPTSGTAQTLPVQCTIKNVGQFSECCYQTSFGIGSFVYDVTGFFSDFETNNGGLTVTGGVWEWGIPTYASGPSSAYSGEKLWGTTLASTYPASSNCQLTTPSFTVPADGDLTYYHWFYIENSYDGYNVKISTDGGSTWNLMTPEGGYTGTANTANPLYPQPIFCGTYNYWQQVTFDLEDYEGMSVMFRFDFGCDGSVQYAGAYIDDILVGEVEISLVPEYSDIVCTIELDPGQEATLDFDDWTPDALALGISGDISYGVIAEQMLSTDQNPDNDQLIETIVLNYWHDVKVSAITKPSLEKDPWDLLYSFDLEVASGALGNAGAEFDGTYFYSTRWATNLIHQYDLTGTLVKEFSIPGVSGLRDLAYNENTGYFYGGAAAGTIWEMDFDSETLVGTLTGTFASRAIAYNADDDVIYCSNWADPVWVVDPSSGAILSTFNLGTTVSTYGFAYDNGPDGTFLYVHDQGSGAGFPQYIYQWDLTAGAYTGFTYDVAADFPTTAGIAGGLFINSGFVPNKLVIGGCLQGTPDMMFVYELRGGGSGGGGYPPISVWVAPGSQQIEAIVGNDGVFEETGLTCYGELYQFVDDPENGTLVWEDSIANIALDPLGDEETVPFGSVNFNMQGPWGLYIEFPLGNDDKQNNNQKALGIGVDDTDPTSSHTLNPATPNGENGWYVSDVTVTLTGEDGTQDWQSGVKELKYKVNGGATQTIPGSSGSFVISDDGENIQVEYWSVDKVLNEGAHHTFEIDMDQTGPIIDLSYEVTGGNAIQGWEFTFTATSTDAMSGMERVEFYLNGILQDTVTGPGPEYQWVILYFPLPHTFFRAVGYDMAGNSAYDEIEDPVSHSTQSNSNPVVHQQAVKINPRVR